MLVRDAKGIDGEEREREIESVLHYSNTFICSFSYHHFVLSFVNDSFLS